MSQTGITLDQLLAGRDRRRERQLELLAENPSKTLVLLTIIMPGSVKRSHESLVAAEAAIEALRETFAGDLHSIETHDLPTGYEAFLLVDESNEECKRKACAIEDHHPLGRLFDIDVIANEGVPLSRRNLGLPGRKCLICGEDARLCMRLNKHSYDDLLARIARMVREYERERL